MKSIDELTQELDALKTALLMRELSEAEIEELDSAVTGLKALLEAKKPSGEKKLRNITEMEGLGKEIWESIDVDEYLRKERQSWR